MWMFIGFLHANIIEISRVRFRIDALIFRGGHHLVGAATFCTLDLCSSLGHYMIAAIRTS